MSAYSIWYSWIHCHLLFFFPSLSILVYVPNMSHIIRIHLVSFVKWKIDLSPNFLLLERFFFLVFCWIQEEKMTQTSKVTFHRLFTITDPCKNHQRCKMCWRAIEIEVEMNHILATPVCLIYLKQNKKIEN